MSGTPRWWPYRVPIEVAVKKTAVAVVGVIVGANVVSYYWKPMQDYEDTLNRGKIELLRKYKAKHDERIAKVSIDGQVKGVAKIHFQFGGSDHYGSDGDLRSTLFKRVFKMYKRRAPPPDLSDVLDPSSSSEFGVVNRQLLNSESITASELEELGLKPLEEWNVKTLKDRLGLYIIPNVLRDDAVEMWLHRVFKYAEPPNITNLTAHGTSPKSDVLRLAGKSLRWTTLGIAYNWDTKEYPLTGDPLPKELVQFADVVTRYLGLGPMHADATIVNYYPPKSTLSPHVDRSERTSAPLVSFSLGQSAIYLTGGNTLDDEVIPLWLRSGDILVMYGSQRLVYHAVAAIHQHQQFTFNDPLLQQFANTSRVNITVRQVNSVPS